MSRYDWTKPDEALENIKESILIAMQKEEKWYEDHCYWHSIFSRTIRVVTITLFSLGIILPIINMDMVKIQNQERNVGYICLAIGGLLLLLDKYLGISSGYVRFYIAKLDIQKNTNEFISNWYIEKAKANFPMTVETIVALLNLIKQFKQAVFTTIQVETGAWATEFQTQSGELYELFKQKQSETIKRVDILVEVQNYTGYSQIEVGVDNDPFKILGGNTSIIFRSVSIQPHVIRIRASKHDGSIISFSRIIDITPGNNGEITLTLP